MTIIDENGQLFGFINVFDALVVLVVIAVLGTGLVVVNPLAGSGGGAGVEDESATHYATIDLGEQSRAVADRISEGDTGQSGQGTNDLAITDTYVGPGTNGNVTVIVQVRVPGTLEETNRDEPMINDSPLRRGDDLFFETSEYEVSGEVLELAAEGESLRTEMTPVLIEATLPKGTASYVNTGDAYRLTNRTVATIDESIIPPAENPSNRTAQLSLSVQTISHSGNKYFGTDKLVAGQTLPFRTDTYMLSGSVMRWGNVSPGGASETTTVDVKLEDVPPDIADGIETGMVEQRDNTTLARITEKHTEPASVVITTDDGNIYERDHPANRDITLTVELRTRQTEDGLHFHMNRLREGTTIVLDFRTIVVDGTVIEIKQ